jgi:signal transduction histidine kinase
MLSRLTARMAFAIAIGLLAVCAILVYSTLVNFSKSEQLVYHTQHVRELLGEAESDIASAARARLTYVFNGEPEALEQYQRSLAQIPPVLQALRRNTADNPAQQRNCDRLEQLVNDRIQLLQQSVNLKQSGAPSPAGQPDMTRQSVAFGDEIVAVTQAMRAEESRLLDERTAAARSHFIFAIAVLIISFSASVLLLFWHYRLLRDELHARERAEQAAGQAAAAAIDSEHKARQSEHAAVASNEAARRLSTRLLQLQDDERRKFSRELHDSIGQYLAAAKMLLSSLAMGHDTDRKYSECLGLLDQAMMETRTISHLLHPPGLDEAGFSSAATWYTEGFSKRSGLDLKISIADPPQRLPREIEIALFRVLQESLTNIHRHSKSSSAEVWFEVTPGQGRLMVKDNGTGISKEVLDRFKLSGTSGVGLAGMRERIRELGGKFEVQSSAAGTCIQVVVPLTERKAFAADRS